MKNKYFVPKHYYFVNPLQTNYLLRLGGPNLKGAVKLIMDSILTNSLQGQFNWTGRLGAKSANLVPKTAFKDTLIQSIITSESHV